MMLLFTLDASGPVSFMPVTCKQALCLVVGQWRCSECECATCATIQVVMCFGLFGV